MKLFLKDRYGVECEQTPLLQGRKLKTRGKQYWIDFVYERFHFVFTYCEKITHKSGYYDQFIKVCLRNYTQIPCLSMP
ncbi:hypothetical protein Syun_026139 [Stephania yunnanensis]|uniref:Uncharacterized protein n=1 Tax=Stephania yunnanensis TaxID=152371 RepID=A0AAP0ETE9_9MAGN